MNDTITALDPIQVGVVTDAQARTGCTVALLGVDGLPCGVEVRGSAPGTRETDLLEPGRTVGRAHAIVLAGGSAFGLAAADGVAQELESRGIGFDTRAGLVPIVPAAVIFDLASGDARVRPGPEDGRRAVRSASSGPVPGGRIGAGAGAMISKLRGFETAVAGGQGNALVQAGGYRVAALAVVNAVGVVCDPVTGVVVAGQGAGRPVDDEGLIAALQGPPWANTTLVLVATDAPLDTAGCRNLARAAHAGLARAVRPSQTALDGDTIFAVSTGTGPAASRLALEHAAAVATARAIVDAVATDPRRS